MTSKRITDLDLLTVFDPTDVFPIVDVPANETKKTTLLDLMAEILGGEADPLSIHKDGSSVATVKIPFAYGVEIGSQSNIFEDVGDDSLNFNVYDNDLGYATGLKISAGKNESLYAYTDLDFYWNGNPVGQIRADHLNDSFIFSKKSIFSNGIYDNAGEPTMSIDPDFRAFYGEVGGLIASWSEGVFSQEAGVFRFVSQLPGSLDIELSMIPIASDLEALNISGSLIIEQNFILGATMLTQQNLIDLLALI